MVTLRDVATRFAAPGGYLISLSDLVLTDTPAGLRLYSASAQGGGILTLDPLNGLALQGQTPFATSGGMDAPRQLHLATVAGSPGLLALGRQGTEVETFAIGTGGIASAAQNLIQRGAGIESAAAVASAIATVDQHTYVLMANRLTQGLDVWERTGVADLTRVVQSSGVDTGSATSGARDITAMVTVTRGAQSFVLTLSGEQDNLNLMQVSAAGQLVRGARLEPGSGLAIAEGTVLDAVTVGDRAFVLVGAAGSGTLAVVEVMADGALVLRDQVLDELGTRFAGVTALATVQVDGQVFVAAGGSDDGVSLMTLLPDGRLVHLATLADGIATALTNPAALAMGARAAGLDLFVAGGGAPGGISHLRAELGTIGMTRQLADGGQTATGTAGRDQILGGTGADDIRGGAGDDILVDGAGRDTLYGGAGEDVFVLRADGAIDVIADFEVGIDRLDMGDLGRFYTLDALSFIATATGGELSIGTERVVLTTADGRPLRAGDLHIDDLRDLTHLPVTPPQPPLSEPPNLRLTGGAGADTLTGDAGQDTLEGVGGGDRLSGAVGNDLLLGGTVRPVWDAVAAQVYRLYHATLDRDPDMGGMLSWHGRLLSGSRSLTEVAQGFVGSKEFTRVYGPLDNADFVTLLYRNVLDRDPDAAGLAYWTGLLDAQTRSRAAVVIGFSDSNEFRQSTAAAALTHSSEGMRMATSDDVFRLYRATLGRDPDTGGFLSWSGRLADGWNYRDVVAGFVGSREFRETYGTATDAEFVTLLYRNVLGRAPDPTGFATWTGHLAAGTRDRAQVVEAFAQSVEFTRASAIPLRDWMRARGMDDVLDGGAGDDVLSGGQFSDCFVFRADAPGHDRVIGLEAWDQVAFQGFGLTDATAVRALMTQVGGNVVFDSNGVQVTFHNTLLSAFDDSMFVF